MGLVEIHGSGEGSVFWQASGREPRGVGACVGAQFRGHRTPKTELLDVKDLDPTKYRENRIAALKKLADPYPHKWNVTISIPYLVEKYKDIESGVHMESELLGLQSLDMLLCTETS